MRENLCRTYKCTECSKAIHVEKPVPANEFGIKDPSGTISEIIVYTTACRDDRLRPFVDGKRPKGFVCRHGDATSCGENCSTCKYGKLMMVGVELPSSIDKTRRAVRDLSITRMVYHCTNVQRMKQFNSGTVMSAYIRCNCYERDDTKNAKN